MRTTLTSLMPIIIAIAITVAAQAQPNLVTNGDFELPLIGISNIVVPAGSGQLSGWRVSGGSGIDLVSSSLWEPASGVQSISLNWTSPCSILQNLDTIAGQSYQVSFWMAAEHPAVRQHIRTLDVRWNAITVASFQFNPAGHTNSNMGWTWFTVNVVGSGSDEVAFVSTTTGDFSYGPAVDDIRIEPSCSAEDVQPPFQSACQHAAVSFEISSTFQSAQWRHGGINLIDGGRVLGATTAMLTITDVQATDAGQYDCVVTNACDTVVSDPAELSVYCACNAYSQLAGLIDDFALPMDAAAPSVALLSALPDPAIDFDDVPQFGSAIQQDIRTAGLLDNFALPVDPASPSAPLAGALQNPAEDFDFIPSGVPSEAVIAHTFTGLPIGTIVGATLEFRAQAGTGQTCTDRLRMGFTTNSSFLDVRFSEFLGSGGPGGCGEQQPGLLPEPWVNPIDRVFDVDLAGLVGDLNAFGFLDVLVGDDSGVDYMRLTLDVEVPAAAEAYVAHTFSNIPADLVSATLEFRVRAGDNLGVEPADRVGLAFSNGGGLNEAWGRYFGAGQASDGLFAYPWTPSSGETITLDLTALPLAEQQGGGTVNLLPQIIANGYLDFYVGTSTGVDYALLSGTRSDGTTVAYVASEPQPQNLCAGQTATFTVTGGGTPPLSYQWRKDGMGLPGATDSTLTIAGVTSADSGAYDCVVSNACHAATSGPAALTVEVIPGDFNEDGAVNAADFATIEPCVAGPDASNPGCDQQPFDSADLDGDGDIDMHDFAHYQWMVGNSCT